MTEYEIIIESVNPCGGEQYAQREVIEAECESPEAYVREHGRLPIREIIALSATETKIITGDEGGYIIRYTFSE